MLPTGASIPQRKRSLTLSAGKFAKAIGGNLGRDVALRRSQHFKSNHKFSDGGRAQQRRIEVRVKMPFGMRLSTCGGLMESHRVGEGNAEHLVVGGGYFLQNLAERTALLRCEFGHIF